jgi:hypothetical protein
MKTNSFLARSAICLGLLSLVSACGGGGGDSTPVAQQPTVVAAPVKAPVIYGQDEAKVVAGFGLVTIELVTILMQVEQAFFANFLQSFTTGTPSGSSAPVTVSCVLPSGGNGSITVSVAKAGVYTGLKAADSVDLTFNSCTLGTSGTMLNGRAVMVPSANYANLGANFAVQYKLTTTNFNMTNFGGGGEQTRSSGEQSVKYDTTVTGPSYPDVSTIISNSYTLSHFPTSTSSIADIGYTLSPLVSVSQQQTASGTFISRVAGNISADSSSGPVFMDFLTLTPLTGNMVAGRPLPTAGVIRVKDTGWNLLTETTVQGLSASVKADSNGDGTLDLNFNTTYVALTY